MTIDASLNERWPSTRLFLWPKRLVYLSYAIALLAIVGQPDLRWPLLLALTSPLLISEIVLRVLVAQRRQLFEKSLMAYLNTGRERESLSLFMRQYILRFAAPRYYLWGKLGMIFTRLERLDLAVVFFRQAVSDAPAAKRYPLAMSLGDILFKLGHLDEAEQQYHLALASGGPESPRLYSTLARLILQREGDPTEAEAFFKLALVSNESDIMLRIELILLLIDQNNIEEAQQQLQLAHAALSDQTSIEQRAALEQTAAALHAALSDPVDPPASPN